MKFVSSLSHRLHWVNLPGALLIALLQRTPVLRLAVAAEEMVVASPIGTVLRSAVTAAASLGAVHALAGATQFQFTQSPAVGTVGTPMAVSFAVTGAGSPSGSYVVTGNMPPGLSVIGVMGNGVVNTPNFQGSATISGTPTAAGTYTVSILAYEFPNGPFSPNDTVGPQTLTFNITGTPPTILVATPSEAVVGVGGTASFGVGVTSTPAATFQWQRNGANIAGANSANLSFSSVQPADAGLYRVVVSNPSGSVTSGPFFLGISSTAKVIGAGTEVGPDILHPNGITFDQILLEGGAATVTADPGQVLRISYVDVNDDIVQVEFSGAGALTLVLDPTSLSGPATPVNYNQPTVSYMKGHASIVITGADETTNLGVFSVGTANAVNQSLFKGSVVYDGFADISFVAILSPTGKFAGLRSANAHYFATRGYTGIYAPGVSFVGGSNTAPVFIGNVSAFDTATPVILLGSGPDTSIRGGDLLQANGQASPPAVQVSGITQLKFVAGSSSHGLLLPAQTNKGVLMQNGVNVTTQIVVNPPSP